MNQKTLLAIYERLESLLGKLPGPLQNAIKGELRPIKQTFLTQRLARLVIVGQNSFDLSGLFSGLLGNDLQMVDSQSSVGWVTYQMRGKGGFRILDARRLNDTSLSWKALSDAVAAESPDLFLFVVNENMPKELGLECEQTARLLELAEQRHQSKAGLIGIFDGPERSPSAPSLELQAWLSAQPRLASHFVKALSVSSFVRFRVDGSIDPDRDERRNLDVLGELIVRELPEDAQIDMARLVDAKKVQTEIAGRLVRSITTICAAIGAQPIPLADFPILTALQAALVTGIMNISGRELGIKTATEFFGALGANIGAGMILREAARAGVKFLPGWGNAISGGIAAAGTYAIGRSAVAYFVEGLSLAEARKIFRRRKLQKRD
jgi:uncharacterized protein (DUF697 family)